jgi:hypothetical protein
MVANRHGGDPVGSVANSQAEVSAQAGIHHDGRARSLFRRNISGLFRTFEEEPVKIPAAASGVMPVAAVNDVKLASSAGPTGALARDLAREFPDFPLYLSTHVRDPF